MRKLDKAEQWFEEDAAEVSVHSLQAFGGELVSRYGEVQELIELLSFARLVAKKRLHPFVLSVFYDSKAALVTFDFHPGVLLGSPVEQELHRAALQSISQFVWLDHCVWHGRDNDNIPEI